MGRAYNVSKVTQPFGLAADDLNWHHTLDQAIFDGKGEPSYISTLGMKLGQDVDIHSSEWGWILRQEDHTGRAGVGLHNSGWADAWKKRLKELQAAGVKELTNDILCHERGGGRCRVFYTDDDGRKSAGVEVRELEF